MNVPGFEPNSMMIFQFVFGILFNLLIIGILVWGIIKTRNVGFTILSIYAFFNLLRSISSFVLTLLMYSSGGSAMEVYRIMGIFSTVSSVFLGIILILGLGFLIMKYPSREI
ncbi:MAG: hypothetical protein PHV06_06965 [bacterium]|nr:hypothetical protein [bacterium]